jgi:hypothetical protein
LPKFIDENGNEHWIDVEFVSEQVYRSYTSGEPCDRENCFRFELKDVGVHVWVTKAEKEELLKLSSFDDISNYADTQLTRSIPTNEFNKWYEELNREDEFTDSTKRGNDG